MDIGEHFGYMKIEVMISFGNVLKKCIIKITHSNISSMFVYTFFDILRFANIFQRIVFERNTVNTNVRNDIVSCVVNWG